MNIYIPYTARLPSAYQEVEYIETTGTQYITTSITPNTNTQVEVKIEVTTTAMDKTIFGTNRWSTYYHLTPYSNAWYYWLNGVESHAWTYSNVVWTQYEVVYNNSNSQLSINWTEVWSTSWTTSTNPLEIAKRASDNTKWVFKYFYFNVYDKSESKYIMKLIPCYRKSDSVIWMYDLVNNQFYTNSWTGTFSKGNDVTMSVLKNIYIGEYGWKPWENTVAYYKFDWNLNDSTENHLNLTNDGSVSYNTSPKSLNLWTSTWLYNTSNTDLFNHDWTYNIRVYLNALPTPDTWVLFSIGWSWTRKMICCWIGTGGAVRLDFWGDDHAGSTILQTWKRYNLCWTYNYSSRNYKTYINNTIDMNASLWSQYSISATEIRIGKFPAWVSDNWRINWKISNAILENIERQAQEISDYYNLTKSNYWL